MGSDAKFPECRALQYNSGGHLAGNKKKHTFSRELSQQLCFTNAAAAVANVNCK